MSVWIRKASKQDLPRLQQFLLEAKLGADGLNEETIDYFLLLENEQGLLNGSLGMETFGEAGLLRSLVISPGQANQEIITLFTEMVQLAKEKGIHSLYLATNKSVAVPFFELMGFRTIVETELPAEFYQSEHIRHVLNVDNSLFLKFSL